MVRVPSFSLFVISFLTVAGDIVYTHILNMEIIVLNSEEVAIELLENRSRIYSDRPYIAMSDLCASFNLNQYIISQTTVFTASAGNGQHRSRDMVQGSGFTGAFTIKSFDLN
jgi:hypothetical protein